MQKRMRTTVHYKSSSSFFLSAELNYCIYLKETCFWWEYRTLEYSSDFFSCIYLLSLQCLNFSFSWSPCPISTLFKPCVALECGKETILFLPPFYVLCSANNQINMRQINRRKCPKFITYAHTRVP